MNTPYSFYRVILSDLPVTVMVSLRKLPFRTAYNVRENCTNPTISLSLFLLPAQASNSLEPSQERAAKMQKMQPCHYLGRAPVVACTMRELNYPNSFRPLSSG
jgi:hypothetical protein